MLPSCRTLVVSVATAFGECLQFRPPVLVEFPDGQRVRPSLPTSRGYHR